MRWFQIGDQHIHLMPAPQPDVVSPRHIALAIDDAQAGRAYFSAKGVPTVKIFPFRAPTAFSLPIPTATTLS
ncbi:MAG: hypothetical protein H6641_13010 [Caldilineaceae bacterium]|nr:hypothetical protein [Caldilineaceae bacterium]